MDGVPGQSGVRVVSAVPGRLRLRAIDRSARAHVLAVAEEVGRSEAVTSVDVRAASASVVVRFQPEDATAVADLLLSLGVELRAGLPLAPARDPASAIGAAALAANQAVGRRLDGTDLRVLVPVGLGVLAARRAMRGEERLADAPWYVLAWYASETFLKFHGSAATASPVAGSEGE